MPTNLTYQLQYFMMIMTLLISQITLGSMGIVQVRNSDGKMEMDLTNTTYDLYEQYDSDDHAKWLVDYIQQHVSVFL